MAAHRYWRLYNVVGNNLSSGAGSREIELRESIGGADVTGSGTASASNIWFNAVDSFDNNTGTGWWDNSASTPRWIKYDFGAGVTKDIVEVVIGTSQVSVAQSINGFDLQWSDDNSTWTTVFTVSDPSGWGVVSSKTYNASTNPGGATSKKVWRVKITSINSGADAALVTVSMRLTTGGANQCSGGRALATSQFGTTNDCISAFDGSNVTLWKSAGGSFVPGEWVGYEFTGAKDIIEVMLRAESPSSAPKDFTIDYWNGSAWTVAATYTGQIGWTSGEERLFTFGFGPSTVVRPYVWVNT